MPVSSYMTMHENILESNRVTNRPVCRFVSRFMHRRVTVGIHGRNLCIFSPNICIFMY